MVGKDRGFTALVVDDELMVLDIVTELVSSMDGCTNCASLHHTAATSVAEVAAHAQGADLLLLDHHLQGELKGVELARRLRTSHEYGGLIIVNTGETITVMQQLRESCPFVDGVVGKGTHQTTLLRDILSSTAGGWAAETRGTTDGNSTSRHEVRSSRRMVDDLANPSEDVRDRAREHRLVCANAAACPALVAALEKVEAADDEQLAFYVGRALTVLLQTRRAARAVDGHSYHH